MERSLVTQWHKNNTVMGQSRHCCQSCAFLTTTLSSSADEHAGHFAPVTSTLPDAAGLVPEGLPLSWEVAVSGWDAEKEGIVLQERLRILEDGDFVVLWGSVHLL